MKSSLGRMVGFCFCIIPILMAGCRSIPVPGGLYSSDRDEGWIQDLTYLNEYFPRYNQSFDEQSLVQFQSILSSTIDAVSELTDNEIYVRLLAAAAAPGDGHTSVNFMPSSQKLRRMPIRFYWFSDGLYVIRSAPEHVDLLGSRVVEIGGVPPEKLVGMMRDLVPGNESNLRYESIYFLNSPDFLEGLGIITDPSFVELVLETTNGALIERKLSAMPVGEEIWGYNSWRELSPLSTESMDAPDFHHVLESVDLPLYLSHPNQSSFVQTIDDGTILYIQVNQNTNLNSDMGNTADAVENLLSSNDIDTVIVDLRFNTGGNLLLTTDLVRGIPKWHTGSGSIYIIIGGPTFSAGIVTAARLKYYSGDRAVVAGEPAAEDLQFWAETRFFTLPNSNIRFYAAHRYHNWENSNYDRSKKHFWLMRRVGVPAGDLDVDLPIAVSFSDYLAARDTTVDTILQLAAARETP